MTLPGGAVNLFAHNCKLWEIQTQFSQRRRQLSDILSRHLANWPTAQRHGLLLTYSSSLYFWKLLLKKGCQPEKFDETRREISARSISLCVCVGYPVANSWDLFLSYFCCCRFHSAFTEQLFFLLVGPRRVVNMGEFKRVKIAVFKKTKQIRRRQHDASRMNIENLLSFHILSEKSWFSFSNLLLFRSFLLMDCFQLTMARTSSNGCFFSFLFSLPMGVFGHVESLIFISKVRI